MTAPDGNLFGPAAFVVGQGITAFMQFMPNIKECRRNHPDDDPAFAADVRIGEAAATATTVGLGLIAASFTRSPVPAYLAILLAVGMIVMFESALRSNRPFEPSITRYVNLADAESSVK